jgi:hypothetical protein
MSINPPTFDPTKPVVVSTPAPSVPNPAGGPKTDTGKAISSRNSLRHGCCSDSLILKTENSQHYKSLEATWFKAYSPKDEAETHLVQELANADWFSQRATRSVNEVEAQLFETEPNQLNWTEQQHRSLGRFLRYQTTRANNLKRARKAVEEFRASRTREKLAAEKLITAQVRRKAVQEKNKPEPTWKEHLEGMRQKAIALGYAPPDPI